MQPTLVRSSHPALFISIFGMVLMAAAVMAVSGRDSDGTAVRLGMVMVVMGAAFLLPWQVCVPAAILVWLLPNGIRSLSHDEALFGLTMLLELPGLVGLAACAALTRTTVSQLETESMAIAGGSDFDEATGVYDERALRPALEAELTRAHRFNRTFAFVLIGIGDLRQRYTYRDEEEWNASYLATAQLLRRTRKNIDRVYRWGAGGFAMILPESGEKEVTGLVRRLRRLANTMKPREGEPGGPLPVAFGATFFPAAASSVDDLLRRADIALKVAEKNASRLQLDGAEAPEMAPPESMRQEQTDDALPPRQELGQAIPSIKGEPEPDAATVAPRTPVHRGLTLVPVEAPDAGPPLAEESAPQPEQPASLLNDESLEELGKRLDETLEMIRGLRTKIT